MNLEQDLRRAFAPRDPVPDFEGAVMARVSVAAQLPGRRLGRPILYGTILVATAAAAMLTSGLVGSSANHSEVAVSPQEDTAGDGTILPGFDVAPAMKPIESSTRSSETTPAGVIRSVAAPLFTVRVALQDPPEAERAAARVAGSNPTAQQILQSLKSLQTALVAELRRVPGLVVLDKDPTEITPMSRHYRLRITPFLFTELDGRIERWEHGYPVGLSASELQPDGKSTERLVTAIIVGVDSIATCTGVAPAVDSRCPAVPEAAAELVHQLRQEVFPPESAVTRPLQVRFGDPLLAPEERFKSFADLVEHQDKSEGKSLLRDKDVVRGAIELARLSDPVRRAQVWRAMRGVGDPLLVEPLLASLQLDPEGVRIAAIETLAADFSSDRRVRLALESAAIADPRPLVRAVAQRGLTGEEGWRSYVASSLKNSSLPDARRVEALMYELYPPKSLEKLSDAYRTNYSQVLNGMDDAAVRALVEIFPRAEVFRSGPSNNLLGNFAAIHVQNPAVTELLLHVLAHDTKAMNREVAGKYLIEVHRSEPGVGEALAKAVSGDPDPEVRDDLRQMMERRYE
jgi:hypothetical protein